MGLHLFSLLIALLAPPAGPAAAASAPAPGAGRPPAQEPAEQQRFDHRHGGLNGVLREFVKSGGEVDYAGLRARGRDRLRCYLNSLEAVALPGFRAWTSDQRQAFWINAYNAYTLWLIVDNEPVESVRDHGTLFSSVFSKRFIPLQHLSARHRKPLSLGEVEHEILGRGFESPLFHFAIVCASRSCPELLPEAYTAETLGAQLERQARRFLADTGRNDGVIRNGALRISKIFDWSEHELAKHPGGIRGILRDHGPPAVAGHADLDAVKLRYRDYDWRLNAWRPRS